MMKAEKLADLRGLPFIEVAELVKVSWPAPDGDLYYVSTLDPHIFRDLPAGVGPLELRLPGRSFQDILNDTTIADDRVNLRLWDADGAITDLAQKYGAGQRVEIFYWFPQVALFWSQWFGHLQPVEQGSNEWYDCTAEIGFMSSMLPLPRRAFFNTCQAMFGGWLTTQQEIDDGDCPYNRHLTDGSGGVVLDALVAADAQNVDTSTGGVIKNGGAADGWDAGARHSIAINEGEDAVIEIIRGDAYAVVGFSSNPILRSFTDFLVALQWNPAAASPTLGSTLTLQYNYGAARVWPAANSANGDTIRVELRAGRFRFYGPQGEIAPGNFQPPAPVYPLYMGVAVENMSAGATSVKVKIGNIGTSVPRGNLDPSTSAPFTDCPRNRPACVARLGDDLSYLGFDTVIQSYTVGQTKGPNLTVTTRGNESNLKRPLRVIFGERDVADLDLLAYSVEPDTKHPEGGAVTVLFAECEGPILEATQQAVNGTVIGAMHLNQRNGDARQSRTGFSAQVGNYSSTALFFGRAQGDFTKTSADQLRGTVHIKGLRDVRRYSNDTTFAEEYSTDRAWCLLHCLRNKRWGYGLDVARFVMQDWIDLAKWGQGIVSFTDTDGTLYTGQRTTFNAELIDRTVQQQINDICLAGRFALPYVDGGKLRIKPLAAAPEFLQSSQFTEKTFLGALKREPTSTESSTWTTAIDALIVAGDEAALLADCQARVKALYESSEYLAFATADDVFIADLYAGYLTRVADADGASYWLRQLAAGMTRSAAEDNFGASIEFQNRIVGLFGYGIPLFTDRGDARNIIWDNDRSTLVRQVITDADLPNRVVLTFDDSAHGTAERPLTFEDEKQQLAAGRAFGDTTRRVVEKAYAALGVTNQGEAARLGNLLLHLGAFDEGGTKNNLRFQFSTWFSECVDLRKYDLIKIESDRLDRINDIRAAQSLERFDYFRVRTIRRGPDLKVEISAQAYPRAYYDSMESWTQPPPIVATGGLINPGGDLITPPTVLPVDTVTTESDRIIFKLMGPPVV
jgi:hypothetical protein